MDEIKFKGNLFDVVERKIARTITTDKAKFEKEIKYELVRRGPGVRAIILKDEKILLNREYRYELDRWDYRLPGGKVFDSIADYEAATDNMLIYQFIENGLENELKEEADIQIVEWEFLEVLHCGFTVEWDLYYFLISNFKLLPSFYDNKIQKTEYEYITHCWIDRFEVLSMCLNGELSEARSAYALIKYLMQERGN